MEREVRWERMFPDQLEAAFAETPVLYIPYGLCEPHGPQNTLGLDALKAHAICCRAARADGGIVAPPDYWHIHEVGHYAAWARREVGEVARNWLTAVPPWIHFKNVCYHVRAADADRLPRGDPAHRPLRAELAGPEDAGRRSSSRGSGRGSTACPISRPTSRASTPTASPAATMPGGSRRRSCGRSSRTAST